MSPFFQGEKVCLWIKDRFRAWLTMKHRDYSFSEVSQMNTCDSVPCFHHFQVIFPMFIVWLVFISSFHRSLHFFFCNGLNHGNLTNELAQPFLVLLKSSFWTFSPTITWPSLGSLDRAFLHTWNAENESHPSPIQKGSHPPWNCPFQWCLLI